MKRIPHFFPCVRTFNVRACVCVCLNGAYTFFFQIMENGNSEVAMLEGLMANVKWSLVYHWSPPAYVIWRMRWGNTLRWMAKKKRRQKKRRKNSRAKLNERSRKRRRRWRREREKKYERENWREKKIKSLYDAIYIRLVCVMCVGWRIWMRVHISCGGEVKRG